MNPPTLLFFVLAQLAVFAVGVVFLVTRRRRLGPVFVPAVVGAVCVAVGTGLLANPAVLAYVMAPTGLPPVVPFNPRYYLFVSCVGYVLRTGGIGVLIWCVAAGRRPCDGHHPHRE